MLKADSGADFQRWMVADFGAWRQAVERFDTTQKCLWAVAVEGTFRTMNEASDSSESPGVPIDSGYGLFARRSGKRHKFSFCLLTAASRAAKFRGSREGTGGWQEPPIDLWQFGCSV